MLFNSDVFVFLFVPITVAGFYLLATAGWRWLAILWLVLGSLFFYGWWNPAFLVLIAVSIVVNYGFGLALVRAGPGRRNRAVLVAGIAFNLLLLGYYKYVNFLLANVNALLGTRWVVAGVILPLGISFFTFTQIAFLVDAARGEAREYSFLHYCLFVTFFPHLIAGPILHHREMMPQFGLPELGRLEGENFAVGSTIFAIGLFKKIMLADQVAVYASPVFAAAQAGDAVTMLQAWQAALAYTLQIYFDFSGYSDMAIGLARLFGIRLPLNFASPYRARNIIDFWRRWHMTLSRFLRDYLYIPLGGNRRGAARRYVNLMIVMLLGGLWHGAAWTYVIWGGLHGVYLVVNNLWQRVWGSEPRSVWTGWASRLTTVLGVVVAFVFFRADSVGAALNVLAGMGGWHGMTAGTKVRGIRFAAILLVFAMVAPNTQEIMRAFRPSFEPVPAPAGRWAAGIVWRPTRVHAALTGLLALAALTHLWTTSEFIYFQF